MKKTKAIKHPVKIIINKCISFPKHLSTFAVVFLIVIICFNSLGLIYCIDSVKYIGYEMSRLSQRVDTIENSISRVHVENIDERINSYYRELSNKTDESINRILTIVGILAAIVTFFGILLAFKAPRDIEKRMDELNALIIKSEEASRSAKYQAEVIEAINIDYDGDLSNSKRIKQITKIIKKYPQYPDGYMHRGFIYDQMSLKATNAKKIGFIHLAISDYEIARNLGVDISSYYNDMGVAYSRLKDYHKSISYYSMAINKDPDDAAAYANRGGDFESIGEYKKSIDDFEKALDIDNDFYSAYLGRSYTYHSLWRNEIDPEKRDNYIRLQISDLEKAIEINPDANKPKELLKRLIDELSTKGLIHRFGFLGTQEEVKNIMVAKIDERIGDLQLEEKEYIEAFKQYIDALLPYIDMYLKNQDEKFKDDIIRIISKLYSIDFITIDAKKDNLESRINAFCMATRSLPAILYIYGDKEAAEKLLILLLHYDNNKSASLNLSFMKRRGEAKFTNQKTIDLLELYDDQQSSIWCVNKALCYVDGIDVEVNWHKAIEFIDKSETEIDEAVEWWSQTKIVGEKESNIVLLLFSMSEKHNIMDSKTIEERISIAKKDGYTIPDDLNI